MRTLILVTLVACEPINISLDKEEGGIDNVDDLANACAEASPQSTTLRITFDAYEDGCPWEEGDNLPAQDAHVTARVEQVESLDLGADTVVCDLDLDFQVGDLAGQSMRYDDNFFLTFNDVVLAASYAPLVGDLALDGDLPLYDWTSIAGAPFDFPQDQETYCLGESEGFSTCDIPPPETTRPMAIDFEQEITASLGFRALELGTLDYAFITFGDNDAATDCSHSTFTFDVSVAYITQ